MKSLRVVVATRGEEIGGDELDGSAVEIERARHRPLMDMNHAHDHSRLAGPLEPLAGRVDRAPVVADPAQAGRACVALTDRIGGDQPERTSFDMRGQKPVGKVGNEIGIALRFGVERASTNQDTPNRGSYGICSTTHERRVANDGVEPTVGPPLAAIRPPTSPERPRGTRSPSETAGTGGSIPRETEAGCSMSRRRTSRVGRSIASFR